MPYSRDDTPAAWWRGVEAMPPKPDEPGLQCRHVRLLPGLTNDPVPDDAVRLCVRREPASGQVRPAPSPLEVSVGDRLVRVKPDAGERETVRILAWGHGSWTALGENGFGKDVLFAMKPDYVGPPGSGKPWTLLPPDSSPHADTTLPAAMGHIPGPPTDADVAAMRAEGQRVLDRMKAEYARPDSRSGGSMVHDVPVHAAVAAVRTLERIGYTWHGGADWKPPLGPAPDFARLDAEAARREALERVAEAARAFGGSDDRSFVDRLAGLRDALAALDAEGGP